MRVSKGQIWADRRGRQYRVEGIETGSWPHVLQPLPSGGLVQKCISLDGGWEFVTYQSFEFSKEPLTGADLQREMTEAKKLYGKLKEFFDHLVSQESDGGQTDPVPECAEPNPVFSRDRIMGSFPNVEPATDEQIASLERMLSDPDARPRDGSGISWHSARALLARFRQEHAALVETNEWLRGAERERDEAVARAEKAEAEVARMRPVVEAAWVHVASMGMFTGALYYAVRALREAEAADQ